MVQWVKNLTAVAQVTTEAWVQSLAQHSGLKDLELSELRIGHSCSLDSLSGPGTSKCHGCGHLKKKKRMFILLFLDVMF